MFCAGLVIAVAPMTAGQAQGADGASGEVRWSGEPIPGVTVIAIQNDQRLDTTTDDAGRYVFHKLGPGVWTFEAQMFGFAPQRKDLRIASQSSALNFDLELGPEVPAATGGGIPAVSAAVKPPAAAAPAAHKAQPSLASASFHQLSLKQDAENETAGAPPTEAPGAEGEPQPGGADAFVVNGSVSDGLSGSDHASTSFGNRSGPSAGSIRASAYYSFANSAMNARPYSLTGQGLVQPSYGTNSFGISVGGPLVIPRLFGSDKTFFYINYSGVRSRYPGTAFTTLPSALERSGDFSQSFVQGLVTVADPMTHQPFPGNRIPADRLNAAALGLLSYVPLPNQPGSVQNYRLLATNPYNHDDLNVRLSESFSQNDSLSLSVNMQRRNSESTGLFHFVDDIGGEGSNVSLSWTHNFGTKKQYNSLRASFNRNSTNVLPYFAYGQNVAAELGIQGTSANPINYGPPNLSFTNFGGLSDSSASVTHYQYWSVSDSASIIKGRHNITFGGGFTRHDNNSVTDSNARGSFTFSGLATSAFDANGLPLAGTGYDFADFLLGLPQSSSIRFGNADKYFRASMANAYVLDDFRVLRHLSLNFGLRYEYFTPYTEKYGRIANLDVAPGFTNVAVVTPAQPVGPYGGRFPAGLIDSDPLCLSPRAGLAWRPFGKHHMTVRTGYGIFFIGSAISRFAGSLAAQPPFANAASLNTTADHVLTLQDGFATAPSTTITNTFAVDKNYHVGYSQSWNVTVQQELPYSLVIDAVYMGNKGTGLDIREMPNRAAPGSPLTAAQRLAIGDATTFIYDAPEANSIYHAGQVHLSRRFHSGVSAYATYTYGKSIDDSSTFGGAANTVAQNANNLSAERGLSSFDVRQSFSLSYILTSPFGEKALFLRAGGRRARFLEDWTLSGSMTAHTGHPFTARVLGNLSDTTGTGVVGAGRAEATGLPIDSAVGFFNFAAFTIPPAGEYGNAARNTIPGPSLVSLNIAFGRSFKVGGDHRKLEFRVSSSNVLNHPNYAGFNTVVNASTYGMATAVGGMRTISALLRFRF